LILFLIAMGRSSLGFAFNFNHSLITSSTTAYYHTLIISLDEPNLKKDWVSELPFNKNTFVGIGWRCDENWIHLIFTIWPAFHLFTLETVKSINISCNICPQLNNHSAYIKVNMIKLSHSIHQFINTTEFWTIADSVWILILTGSSSCVRARKTLTLLKCAIKSWNRKKVTNFNPLWKTDRQNMLKCGFKKAVAHFITVSMVSWKIL